MCIDMHTRGAQRCVYPYTHIWVHTPGQREQERQGHRARRSEHEGNTYREIHGDEPWPALSAPWPRWTPPHTHVHMGTEQDTWKRHGEERQSNTHSNKHGEENDVPWPALFGRAARWTPPRASAPWPAAPACAARRSPDLVDGLVGDRLKLGCIWMCMGVCVSPMYVGMCVYTMSVRLLAAGRCPSKATVSPHHPPAEPTTPQTPAKHAQHAPPSAPGTAAAAPWPAAASCRSPRRLQWRAAAALE